MQLISALITPGYIFGDAPTVRFILNKMLGNVDISLGGFVEISFRFGQTKSSCLILITSKKFHHKYDGIL
jgi:hypothetical protein